MKNHDKASLPKIQIKQVQILNRIISNPTLKNNAGYLLAGTTTVDTTTTTTGTAF